MGFRVGVEYTEKQILNKVKTYLENKLYTSFDMFGNTISKTNDFGVFELVNNHKKLKYNYGNISENAIFNDKELTLSYLIFLLMVVIQ